MEWASSHMKKKKRHWIPDQVGDDRQRQKKNEAPMNGSISRRLRAWLRPRPENSIWRRGLSERSEFRSPSKRDWGKGTLLGPRPGANGFGSFCRNKRTSSCGGETPPRKALLHVQIIGEGGVGHQKLVPGFGAFAHEFGEGAVGVEFIVQLDFEEPACGGIERRLLELLGKHLAEALEPADDWRGPAPGFGQDAVFLFIRPGPVHGLAHVDAVERRLGDKDVPVFDQVRDVPEKEGEQQRADMVAVHVRVHEQMILW